MLGSRAMVPESSHAVHSSISTSTAAAAVDVEMDEVDIDWPLIQEWANSNGDPALRALQLDSDTDYQQWLANALGNPDPPVWADADTATLLHLRAGYGRAVGYREVKPAGLLQKMEDITLAKAWRVWDVANTCEVPELDATEKTADMFCDKPRYVDSHRRACPLHVSV